MLTAGRAFTLAGVTFAPGEVVPDDLWMSPAVPERNRQAMVRGRWVRSPELTPDKETRRARKQGTVLRQQGATVVRYEADQPNADPNAIRVTAAFPCTLTGCGKSFTSKSALGGHRRGHVKRGEV